MMNQVNQGETVVGQGQTMGYVQQQVQQMPPQAQQPQAQDYSHSVPAYLANRPDAPAEGTPLSLGGGGGGFDRLSINAKVFGITSGGDTKPLPHREADGRFVESVAAQSVEAVILGINPIPSKAFFGHEGPQPGQKQNPVCMSVNGKTPDTINSQVVMSTSCTSCPLNRFGSHRNGKGKACADKVRVAVCLPHYRPNDILLLQVPPTGFDTLEQFGNDMTAMRCHPHWAIVRIYMKDPNTLPYPHLVFERGRFLEPNEVDAVNAMVESRSDEIVGMLGTDAAVEVVPPEAVSPHAHVFLSGAPAQAGAPQTHTAAPPSQQIGHQPAQQPAQQAAQPQAGAVMPGQAAQQPAQQAAPQQAAGSVYTDQNGNTVQVGLDGTHNVIAQATPGGQPAQQAAQQQTGAVMPGQAAQPAGQVQGQAFVPPQDTPQAAQAVQQGAQALGFPA